MIWYLKRSISNTISSFSHFAYTFRREKLRTTLLPVKAVNKPNKTGINNNPQKTFEVTLPILVKYSNIKQILMKLYRINDRSFYKNHKQIFVRNN